MILDVMLITGNKKVELNRVIEALAWLKGGTEERTLDIFLCSWSANQIHDQMAGMVQLLLAKNTLKME